MVKKLFGVLPPLIINLWLLVLFATIYLPTMTTCPEHFLSGYALLMGMNIGLFALTSYLMVAIMRNTQWSIQYVAFLIVTIMHAYIILGIASSVSSCPRNHERPVVGPPLNLVWSIELSVKSIVTQ